MNVTMEHFQQMCLRDPIMQALYRDEISWSDIPEEDTPLELDDWREYREEKRRSAAAIQLHFESIGVKGVPAAVVRREVTGCWRTPLTTPPPKKVYVVSPEDEGKRTLILTGVPSTVSTEVLRERFEFFGKLPFVHRSKKGFVLLRFDSFDSAKKAYFATMNSLVLSGKKIHVRWIEKETISS